MEPARGKSTNVVNESWMDLYTALQIKVDQLREVADLEARSYPQDEAASPETLNFRARVAPELFQVLVESGKTDLCVGFVVGTAAPKHTKHLHESSMSSHDDHGDVLCIHSVVVRHELRRRGIASFMLQLYIQHVKRLNRFTRVLLLAKRYLIPLYEKSGFVLVGPSAVSHGTETWFELAMDLTNGEA